MSRIPDRSTTELDWHTQGPSAIACSDGEFTAVIVKHSEVRYTWSVFHGPTEVDNGELIGEGLFPGTTWGECRLQAERSLITRQAEASDVA